MVSRFGLEQYLDKGDNREYVFDLTNQVTLHIVAEGSGIVGDAVGDSRTIRTNFSVPTLDTTKDYLKPPINYLLAFAVISNPYLKLGMIMGLNQARDQESQQALQAGNQYVNQSCCQAKNQPIHQPESQTNFKPTP